MREETNFSYRRILVNKLEEKNRKLPLKQHSNNGCWHDTLENITLMKKQ